MNFIELAPKSWWRKLLGFRSYFIIDKVGFTDGYGTKLDIIETHYEWLWRPKVWYTRKLEDLREKRRVNESL